MDSQDKFDYLPSQPQPTVEELSALLSLLEERIKILEEQLQWGIL